VSFRQACGSMKKPANRDGIGVIDQFLAVTDSVCAVGAGLSR
jgi:hypothetical protein